MSKPLSSLARAAVAASLLTCSHWTLAQSWPARTLTWVVPFAAGGPTDAMARDIADRIARQIGQQVIIENVGGAGGTIGAGKAAKASADGATPSWSGTSATWAPARRCTRS